MNFWHGKKFEKRELSSKTIFVDLVLLLFLTSLFGLTQYVEVSCVPYYNETIRVLNWNVYIHPVLLCTLYLTTIYMIKYHFIEKKQKVTIGL